VREEPRLQGEEPRRKRRRRPLFAREGEPEHVPAMRRGAPAPDSAEVTDPDLPVLPYEPAEGEPDWPARRVEPPPALPAEKKKEEEEERESDDFRRSDVYARPVKKGREVRDLPGRRALDQVLEIFTPPAQKEEQALDRQLRAMSRVTRTNLIVSLSPKGGVGKTTCTFLVGNLLASHLKLRTLIMDANRDWGTLASLAPDNVRSDRSISALLANLDEVHSVSELRPYVSRLATGCHLLGAPTDPAIMGRMGPEEYTRLLRWLSRYYEIILLDLGTGVIDPLAQAAIGAADQGLLITTPEYVTTEKVIGVIGYLGRSSDSEVDDDGAAPEEQVLTVVLNRAPREGSGDRRQIEAAFRRQQVGKSVIVPYDDRLRVMLDSATYALDDLPRGTRMSVKRLGLSVAQDLV
jgi:putative peptide zinc metalloprotease protein